MMRDTETFLTVDEIRRLTARTYARAQCRMLDTRGIVYTQDAFGRPIILRSALEEKLRGGPVTPAPAGPDFSVFPALP